MKTGDHKILAGLILASIHINLFHVMLLPPCIGFLILYIGILQKERQAGFFQMDVKEMRVYRAAGAALVLVTAFSSFLSMFWRRPDGTIWSLIPCMLEYVVLYGLIRAHFGRRSLLERCSRQQARFANFLNWLFLVCFVGLGLSKVVPYETFPPLYQAGLYLSAGLLLGGTILWTVVVAAWKPLRGWPVLHGFLAFLTGSSLACLPIIGLILGRVALQGTELPQENDLQTLIGLLLPSASDPFWLYFGLIHFLEVASAGALGLFWLLVRRKIDDFGRDYYVFAANWCGEWAAWGGWFSLIMAGVLCFMLQTQDLLTLENQGALLFVAALFAALLIPSVIWTVIARSATPMRHKIGMIFSLLLLVVAIANSGVLVLL